MKVPVLFTVLCVAYTLAAKMTAEQEANLKKHEDKCIADSGLDKEVLQKAKMEKKYEFDEKMNCFSACMFKATGVMTEEGTMDEDMVRAFSEDNMPKDVVDKAIEACKNEMGKDQCETAGKMVICFMKNNATLSG